MLGASGEDTLWFAYGWPDRATWKAAGRPSAPPSGATAVTSGVSNLFSGGGSSGGGLFGLDMNTLLLIGGGLLLIMMMSGGRGRRR
jgi:hypothetical protein